MRALIWHDIKYAFPVDPKFSIVIVTTTTRSIANACSCAHGHVYVMTTLGEQHSRQLFFQEASMGDPPQLGDHMQLGSEALKKCDGLPLALVTTGRLLQGDPTRERWANLGTNLGKHLETNEALASLKRVLVHSYTSLGSQDVKACLLYLGIYPSGHPIRRGSLIRRWLAEGFVQGGHRSSALDAAIGSFHELLDQSIIQPIDASNAEVKTFQTHGMMIEFILNKSINENFVTLLYDKATLPSNVRWLSVHNKTAASSKVNPKDLRLVRSLTIFGNTHKSVLDFPKYKLMRVLDLEECDEYLEDKHLREICSNLVLLRYLSLGGAATVTVLPKEIKKLQLLETLDVRRTKIEILPKEVLKLPCLIHLFGKFKLEGVGRMGKLQIWLSENSNLETLAGFVGDKSQEFTQLMEHMKHLTKLKIWCESTTDVSSNLTHLSVAIKGFIERGTNLTTSCSLSLNFSGERSQDLLNFSLENGNSYYLSSLKLQGNNIFSLPLFVTMLAGLTKLCLTFPHHRLSGDIGDALSKVRGLKYLKLIAAQLDHFVIRQGALEILQSLCIVVEVMTGLAIEEGALPDLDSLQLLCKDLNGFSSTTIQSLPLLKEVALHDELDDQIKLGWKEAAKNHPRRPKVLFKLVGNEPAVGT
uniref:NB-ARC domain-containing protein n=2 Tax=Triticum urartu TaxID=4572 RepID=A0A8R7UW53_TRIUA